MTDWQVTEMGCVGKFVSGAFAEANKSYPELSASWTKLSHRVGSRLPNSLLPMSIQREGQLDLVIRCVEDECAAMFKLPEDQREDIFLAHHLSLLTQYWIGGTYEIFRLFKRHPDHFQLSKYPPNGAGGDYYLYDRNDKQRAHIMPTGMSDTGSLMWQVIDLIEGASYWVRRRSISDDTLKLWG